MSACDCCDKPPGPYVGRLSAVGKVYECDNTVCGFRVGDTIYEKSEQLFTYPAPGQPSWMPENFSGETFTVVTTKTLSNNGCSHNAVCSETSNIGQRPPPPFRADPPTYSQARGECGLCTAANDFPQYWLGATPVTFWIPPNASSSIYYGFPSSNWPVGRAIAAGASIGFGSYRKNKQLIKWRYEHTFLPTCYLKVWFIKRIRTMSYASGPDFIYASGGLNTSIKQTYQPTSTYEVLPYVYEWNPSDTPCIGKSGDSDDGQGGVVNAYNGNDPYGEVIHSSNINASYPIIYGEEQEVEDPIEYCNGPKTLADIRIAVWKYSFVKGYEPEDPSAGWPFVTPDISGRTRRNGFPIQGDADDGNVGFS